jgi:hypothetical protein
MSREGGRPPAADRNLLWAVSGGTCSYPGCLKPLVVSVGGRWVTVGQIAHIHAHSPGGPRFDPTLSDLEVDSYENSLLLCLEHHRIVDGNPEAYSAETLSMWKRNHEQSSARTALVTSWDTLVAPPPRAHTYIARPNIDDQIATILDQDARVALVGVSGCGKTQIAACYLSDSVDRYTFRWWVRGTSREILENDLEAIGSYIGVYGSSGEPVASVARRVVRALQEIPAWLMIIDDVKDPAAITDVLPQTGGHVIVTTQNAGWFGYGRVFAIPPFDLAESRSLLRSAPTLQSIPDETLDEISTLYAGLPLAIAQATSYLVATGVPIEQYRMLLGERRAELLARGNAGSHPTLAASSSVTLAKLSLNARQLLEMLSNLAPSAFEPISTEDDIGSLLTDPLIMEDAPC